MEAQVAAVAGSPANFELLVGQLLAADNASRQSAEGVYEALKAQQPDATLGLLLQSLRGSDKVQNRTFCAIMLRKVRSRRGGVGWLGSRRRLRPSRRPPARPAEACCACDQWPIASAPSCRH
jgi:hypothetical protein